MDCSTGFRSQKREALARLEVIADTFLSMNAPVQLAMASWLEGVGGIQGQIRERAQRNYAALKRMAAEHPDRLQALEADAGWSAVVVLRGWSGEGDLAEWLVRERGVAVHPGDLHGMAEGAPGSGEPDRPGGEVHRGHPECHWAVSSEWKSCELR